MSVLDDLTRSYRVNAGVYEDESVSAGADGTNNGSPSSTTGVGGEDFFDYNGSQSTEMVYPSTNFFDGVDRALAFRFKTTTTPGASNVLGGYGSTSGGSPAFVVTGNGTNSIQGWMRNDSTSVIKQVATNTDAAIFDGTERVAVMSYNYATDTLTIKELTLGLSGSTSSAARGGALTVNNLGAGAWPRSSPTWNSTVSTSWLAAWDRLLTAQDETDLLASPWPFVAAPTLTITAPDTIQDGVPTTITGTELATATTVKLDVDGSAYLVDNTSNATLGGASIAWTPETNFGSISALPTIPFTDPILHNGAVAPQPRLLVSDGTDTETHSLANTTPAGYTTHMFGDVSGMNATAGSGAIGDTNYVATLVDNFQFTTETTVSGVTLVFDDLGNWTMDATSLANLEIAGSVDFQWIYTMPDTGNTSSFVQTIYAPDYTPIIPKDETLYNRMRGLTQIGTNGIFFAFTDETRTLAEMNGAYFSNKYATTSLTTGDILVLQGSDGTKWIELAVSGMTVTYVREASFA